MGENGLSGVKGDIGDLNGLVGETGVMRSSLESGLGTEVKGMLLGGM
jgi:hypothetical protein